MFSCVRKESHHGEIVNAICQDEECCRTRNQLCCINCIEEDHRGHSTVSIRKIIPELLVAHKEKDRYHHALMDLLEFVRLNFGDEGAEGDTTTIDTLSQRIKEMLADLKKQIVMNNEQINKMKGIFKNLNKNTTPTANNMAKSILNGTRKEEDDHHFVISPSKLEGTSSKFQSNLGIKNSSPMKNSHHPSSSQIASIDTFSHSSKHPYLTLSSDLRTLTKTSHSGHRFAGLSSKCLTPRQNEVRVRIDKSVSGNILVGLCHESIIRQHQFANCYGTNQGTYLIGQNSHSTTTAISFHHSINVMNRKEIIGWNFMAGDEIVIGYSFEEEYVYFRRESKQSKGHGKDYEFSMKIKSQDNPKIVQLNELIEQGLKFIALLQTEGDSVTLVQLNE